MPTPRPHYKERIAHAEGCAIEVYIGMGVWKPISYPAWNPEVQYRVKPESKPDVVKEGKADLYEGKLAWCVNGSTEDEPNLRLTFDGETGQLKAAEVIQQS